MEISPFWRRVRELRRIIAVQLYMKDHRHLEVFITPEIEELKEGGYWDRARVLALQKVRVEEPDLKTLKELEKPRRVRLSLSELLQPDSPAREKTKRRDVSERKPSGNSRRG
jgi:hypothetical protein